MPEIVAASPAPTCFHLNFENGIPAFQILGPDLPWSRARAREERQSRAERLDFTVG
jgi:hypothetical protein